MTVEEREEALESIMSHYGFPMILEEIDKIVARIEKAIMSAPIGEDPQKASLQLYAARMKAEGAKAVSLGLLNKVNEVRMRKK